MSKKKSRKSQAPNWIWIAIAVVVLTVIAGVAFGQRNSEKPLALKIPVNEAYAKYQEGVFVLDVRTQEEWDQAHIADTTLIPLDELPNRINEIPVGQEIVVICNSGNRSSVGRDILLDAGFKQVTSSEGGLQAWDAMHYPLEMQP